MANRRVYANNIIEKVVASEFFTICLVYRTSKPQATQISSSSHRICKVIQRRVEIRSAK